jgi:hydroxyquinol 1,2-dioxygenase
LDSDAVFGVKQELIAEFTQHPPGTGPDGKVMNSTWRKLVYDFALKRHD